MNQNILIRNGYIAIPDELAGVEVITRASPAEIATVVSNLAHYGYVASRGLLTVMEAMSRDALSVWWESIKPQFSKLSGEDRDMGAHIVYKNFPSEVLSMVEGEWVMRQLMIYWGADYDLVREGEEERAPLGDLKRAKVLSLADATTERGIFDDLARMSNRWSDNQTEWAETLLGDTNVIVIDDFSFKENAIHLAKKHFADREIVASTGTDVLRLCAALSEQDISLRTKVRFRSFNRPERRRILAMLEQTKNLVEDTTLRPNLWKRLFERLRPGDYKYAAVQAAYDDLYNGRTKSFNALVDPQQVDRTMLDAIVTRPGEFLRRFHRYYGLFGRDAVEAFIGVLDKLKTKQLTSFRSYIGTINDRSFLIYAPKSNWARAQVVPNNKIKITVEDFVRLDDAIADVLRNRMAKLAPEGVALDDSTRLVKLQTNDQKLAEYGRGTVFDIPKEMTFLRSASFWEMEEGGITWYDNGWNFFDHNWKNQGSCCWMNQDFHKAAVMSGDPINIKDFRNRGCQMIDLYIDKLIARGVRYAVWNILCYSNKKFSEAKEVLATLQMGEDALWGKTYEPSRAQMVFPLKSEALTSYVAYIDLIERKLIYMDAPLRGAVHSADANGDKLAEVMPAYVEYLGSLPSVYDLMRDAPKGDMPVLYSDRDTEITNERAYVFQPENAQNTYERLSITDLVEGTV